MAASRTSDFTAITIGNFDGVHRGHAALVRAAMAAVGDVPPPLGKQPKTSPARRVIVLCFDPHPLTILKPHAAPPALTTFDQRRQWLLELGADEVERIAPTREFLAQEPEVFVEGLVERHRPVAIVEGPDFRFGRGRAGSIETLQALGSVHSFKTIVVDPVDVALADHSLVRASSSIVRWLLARGRVRDARHVLGRPFELCAPIVRGDQRGRALGVPTANLDHGDGFLPANGIYAGFANAPGGTRHIAAISIGTKPTFGAHARVCEAHLVDYDGAPDEYGWTMHLEFHEWLRDQLPFESAQALISQLHRDIDRTKDLLRLLRDTVAATR